MKEFAETIKRDIELLANDQEKMRLKITTKFEQIWDIINANKGNTVDTANAMSFLIQAYSQFLIASRLQELIKVYRYYQEKEN